ncbi:hypothetical protein [Paraburkholderia sp. SIMBA_054]|uniref:hypothetical protein n=1 Tax=Paraburkholderia sp. SIMBA_054 TaxID=3085795 RepID=UPI00397A1838
MRLGKPTKAALPLEQAVVEAEQIMRASRTGAAYGIAYTLDWLSRDCGVSLRAVAPALSREMKANLITLYGLYRPLRDAALADFWGAHRAALDSILASQELSAEDEVSIQSDGGGLVGVIVKIESHWTNDGKVAHVNVILNDAGGEQVGITRLVENGLIQGIKKTGRSHPRATLARLPWYLEADNGFDFDDWSGAEIADFIGSELTGRSKAAQQMRLDAATLLFRPWETDDDDDTGPFDPARGHLAMKLGIPLYVNATKLEKLAWSVAGKVYDEGLRLHKFVSNPNNDD